MRQFSHSIWLAALCAVLCPAAVRAQATNSTAYYQTEDDASQVMPASAMMGGGPCQGSEEQAWGTHRLYIPADATE